MKKDNIDEVKGGDYLPGDLLVLQDRHKTTSTEHDCCMYICSELDEDDHQELCVLYMIRRKNIKQGICRVYRDRMAWVRYAGSIEEDERGGDE